MEALTVEEFKALLKMFFEAGEKRGRYRDVPPSYFEKVNFDRPLCFEDFYKKSTAVKSPSRTDTFSSF